MRNGFRLEANGAMDTYDVVFIDDEEFMTEIFQHFVARKYADWRCVAFNDSAAVQEQITNQALAARVWIVDLMMPEVSGAQVAEAIRANHPENRNWEETLVVAYTALERSELLRHAEFRHSMHLFDWIINKRTMLPEILLQIKPVLDLKKSQE
jgi:CheY-like chemotaxis protein